MNSVAILSVFCILFVWAAESSRRDEKFCDLIKTEEGLKAVVGCIKEHMPHAEHIPPFVSHLFQDCILKVPDEPGSSDTFQNEGEYRDEYRPMSKCIHEEADKAAEAYFGFKHLRFP